MDQMPFQRMFYKHHLTHRVIRTRVCVTPDVESCLDRDVAQRVHKKGQTR